MHSGSEPDKRCLLNRFGLHVVATRRNNIGSRQESKAPVLGLLSVPPGRAPARAGGWPLDAPLLRLGSHLGVCVTVFGHENLAVLSNCTGCHRFCFCGASIRVHHRRMRRRRRPNMILPIPIFPFRKNDLSSPSVFQTSRIRSPSRTQKFPRAFRTSTIDVQSGHASAASWSCGSVRAWRSANAHIQQQFLQDVVVLSQFCRVSGASSLSSSVSAVSNSCQPKNIDRNQRH
jgi:hypothetical protein